MMCLEDTWFVAAFHSYKSAAPPEALAHSGIWLGLWADASGDAAQSASMFILKRQSRALGPGIGCFRELCAGFGDVCTIIARNLAVSYVDRYDDCLHGALYSVKAMPLSFCSQDFPVACLYDTSFPVVFICRT